MGTFKGDRAGVGSAVNDTTQEVGGALGAAVLGSIVGGLYSLGLLLAGAPLAPRRARRFSRLPPAQGLALVAGARSSFRHAFGIGFVVATALAAVSATVALRLLPGRTSPAEVATPVASLLD